MTNIAFISSPYKASDPDELLLNILIAQAMCIFASAHGYTPYASHLIEPQFRCDENPDHRNRSINGSHAILQVSSVMYRYAARTSSGMRADTEAATVYGVKIIDVQIDDIAEYFEQIQPSAGFLAAVSALENDPAAVHRVLDKNCIPIPAVLQSKIVRFAHFFQASWDR